MKTLIIVRHAKSSWKFDDLDDLFRPLKGKGYNDCVAMGERLRARKVHADRIITSPAVRAYSTALILSQPLRYDPAGIIIEPDLYETSTGEILDVIAKTPQEVQTLMLVGHDPSFTDLFRAVTGQPLEKLPTSGVVSITFEVSDWNSVTKQVGNVAFFIKPDKKNKEKTVES